MLATYSSVGFMPSLRSKTPNLAPSRLKAIRDRLLKWGPSHYRSFPWRATRSPWLALAAEVLLQRTRASQALRAYRMLELHYSTAEALASSSEEAEAQLARTVGLRWRVRKLMAAAAIIRDGGGQVPDSRAKLLAIPGVGPYAASAWLSLHNNQRESIVDSNVARWLCRLVGVAHTPASRRWAWVLALADELTPRRGFKEYNYAVLDLTTTLCLPTCPSCEPCPLLDLCATGQEMRSPPRAPKACGSQRYRTGR